MSTDWFSLAKEITRRHPLAKEYAGPRCTICGVPLQEAKAFILFGQFFYCDPCIGNRTAAEIKFDATGEMCAEDSRSEE